MQQFVDFSSIIFYFLDFWDHFRDEIWNYSFSRKCVNCIFKSLKVIINPIVQTYNVSYMGASSLPGACCLGMTIGMALGPLLVSKASLRRLTYTVSWIPAGCWLLMYFILDFTVLIISFLIMARFFNVSTISS